MINLSKQVQETDKSCLVESNIASPAPSVGDESPRSSAIEKMNVLGQHMAARVTYHVSTDSLGHHAPHRRFGASGRRDGWRWRWKHDWRDRRLRRRRSRSWRRGDMDRSWHRWWHRWRCFGPARRSSRFGLRGWHHFADDSEGPKKWESLRADGKESTTWSPSRYRENIVQLIHITFKSALRLFQPSTRAALTATPIHSQTLTSGQDKVQSYYKVNFGTAWSTP